MAKTKNAAQPAKDDTKQAAAPKATAKATAKAKAEERKWDSSKGYTGTQSDYKPPDTDPVKQGAIRRERK